MPRAVSARRLAQIGLMAALTAVGAFLRVPLPYVPITLQLPIVCAAGILLGPRAGAASQAVYLAAGLLGFPIFAHGGGPHYILEPSFGYLVGFVPAAVAIGQLARQATSLWRLTLAICAGVAIVYAIGVAHLCLVSRYALNSPLALSAIVKAGLIPLPKDLALAPLIACLIRRLRRSGAA